MSWLGKFWNGIKDLFGMGSTAAQIQTEQDIANKNFQAQQDLLNFQKQSYQQNYDYQKALQQQIFEREDNAVSRRALDMENAGLSKTLAAGNGAGAGSVVGTSAFTSGTAPKMDVVDRAGRVLQLMQAQADMRKTQAEAIEALKRGQSLDSQILTDEVSRDKLRVQMAIDEENLDQLGLTRQQKELSITEANKKIEYMDAMISSIKTGTAKAQYELENLLPEDVKIKAEQIANLQREGKYKEADILYLEAKRDLLVYEINTEMYKSRVAELDYYYQVNTGLKPSSASNPYNLVTGLTQSKTVQNLVDKAVETVSDPNGTRTYKEQLYNRLKKDKTPR